MGNEINPNTVMERVRSIKLVISDVDGVLTDGGMYYTETGDEFKKFNVRDGVGVALLKAAGLKVGAISGERLSLIARRLDKMGMDFYYTGVKDKCGCVIDICKRFNCNSANIAYIGDEINDFALLGRVGLFIAPVDACADLRSLADHVLSSGGGKGVLREAAELILVEQRVYDYALEVYKKSLRVE